MPQDERSPRLDRSISRLAPHHARRGLASPGDLLAVSLLEIMPGLLPGRVLTSQLANRLPLAHGSTPKRPERRKVKDRGDLIRKGPATTSHRAPIEGTRRMGAACLLLILPRRPAAPREAPDTTGRRKPQRRTSRRWTRQPILSASAACALSAARLRSSSFPK